MVLQIRKKSEAEVKDKWLVLIFIASKLLKSIAFRAFCK